MGLLGYNKPHFEPEALTAVARWSPGTACTTPVASFLVSYGIPIECLIHGVANKNEYIFQKFRHNNTLHVCLTKGANQISDRWFA